MNPELSIMIAEFGSTVDLYRTPTVSAGKYGTPTLLESNVKALILPATDMQRVGLAPDGLGGARAEYIAITTATSFNLGDELRQGSVTYAVLSPPAEWGMGRVTALSRAVSATTQTGGGGTVTINLDFSRAANSHYIGYV